MPESRATEGIDEPVTVVNTMPLPVEVTVTSTRPDGSSTEVRFGPIESEGRATQVVRVQTGGTFVVQAHWTFDDQPRQSNAFTAQLVEGNPLTPVTLTLGMTFARPTMGQWKSVDWDEP